MGHFINIMLIFQILLTIPLWSMAETTGVTPGTAPSPSGATCSAETLARNREIINRCNESWEGWGIDRPPANELRTEDECNEGFRNRGQHFIQGCAQAAFAPFVFAGTLAATGIAMLATMDDTNSDAYVFQNGDYDHVLARVSENWIIDRCGLGAVREEEFVLQECPNNPLSETPRDCNPALERLREQVACRRSSETRAAYREVVAQHEQQARDIISRREAIAASQNAREAAVRQIGQDCGEHINPYRRSLVARFTNPGRYALGEMWHQIQPNPENVAAFNQCVQNHPQASEDIVNELAEDGTGLIDSAVSQYEAFECYSAPVRNELYCDIAMAALSGGALAGKALIRLGRNRMARNAAEEAAGVVDSAVAEAVDAAETAVVAGDGLVGSAAQQLARLRTANPADFQRTQDAATALFRSRLGREPTDDEMLAIYRAHMHGRGEVGLDGTPAGVGNYTAAQIREKDRILAEAVNDPAMRRALFEGEVVGDLRPEMAAFREAYTNGQFTEAGRLTSGDHRFVSAEVSMPDGTVRRAPMQILSQNADGSLEVVVQADDGTLRRMTYPREHLSTMRLSGASREFFAGQHVERFNRMARSGESIQVSSLSGNVYSGQSRGFVDLPDGGRALVLVDEQGREQLLRVDRLNLETIQPRGAVTPTVAARAPPAAPPQFTGNTDYFVRTPGTPLSNQNYVTNAVESVEDFRNFWATGRPITPESLTEATRDMHRTAGLGRTGDRPYGGVADNRNMEYGQFHTAEGIGNRRPSDQYAQAVADQFNLGPISREGRLALPGIPESSQPYNMVGGHYYPGASAQADYFNQGARLLDGLRTMPRGSPDAFNAIADYYQLMANARPFANINNSLFMNQTNYLLETYGFRPMSHGYLDHLAQRLSPDQFRQVFRMQMEGRLPAPDASIRGSL